MIMRRLFVAFIAALIMPAFAYSQHDIKIISYNIKNSEAQNGTNSWEYRYGASADMFLDQNADVMALQEPLEDQIYFITQNFPNYKCVGKGAEDGKKKGEYTAIVYNKKTVSELGWGMFWLSETPEVPSKGWDAAQNCTATWALLKHKSTGKKFYVVNTDLDQNGRESRKNGVQLILDKIAEINKDSLPVVLAGGFDMRSSDASLAGVESAMKNARSSAPKTDNTGTYNNWGKNSDIVDHIYYSGFSSCPEYQTVTKRYADRKFVSDHYPIMVLLNF